MNALEKTLNKHIGKSIKKIYKYVPKDIATVIYEKVEKSMEQKKNELYKKFKKRYTEDFLFNSVRWYKRTRDGKVYYDLDLEELNGKNKVISSVPIHYVGEEYLNKKGIVLQKEKDSVKVECSIESLPKYIDFNIGKGNVGSVYKFGDLEVASEISILDDLNSVIASVIYERKTVKDNNELSQSDSNQTA